MNDHDRLPHRENCHPMCSTKAYACLSQTSPLTPFSIRRRDLGPHDVEIAISYCGVCHTDLHQVRNDWQRTIYPCVPGHEIVGRILRTGSHAQKFKEGDIAAIGCLMHSCRTCQNCQNGLEQFCENGATFTCNSEDKQSGGVTYGGYSESIVADEAFVLRVPYGLDLAATAPLLCAGITTYSPLRHWRVSKGQKVGVIGLGGLGHMAVKFANSFNAKVVVFTTSPDKADDALRLGAEDVVITRDKAELRKHRTTFDFILDTVSAKHDINAYLALLKQDGTLTLVGLPTEPLSVSPSSLTYRRRQFAGSLLGGIQETQEMLDYCGKHAITADIELIPIQQIDQAYERLLNNDVRYRFVIDMESLS